MPSFTLKLHQMYFTILLCVPAKVPLNANLEHVMCEDKPILDPFALTAVLFSICFASPVVRNQQPKPRHGR